MQTPTVKSDSQSIQIQTSTHTQASIQTKENNPDKTVVQTQPPPKKRTRKNHKKQASGTTERKTSRCRPASQYPTYLSAHCSRRGIRHLLELYGTLPGTERLPRIQKIEDDSAQSHLAYHALSRCKRTGGTKSIPYSARFVHGRTEMGH